MRWQRKQRKRRANGRYPHKALEERQRLAQNLHDAVNQSLFSASLIAEVLPRLWERNHDEGRQSLEDLRRLTRGAMAEMRGLLAELRPLVLTDSEMGDLLRQLGDSLTGRTNIPVAVTVGEKALPAEVQVAFYRFVRKSLHNIAKHAGPAR
jgi:signal transduction histidine kinase